MAARDWDAEIDAWTERFRTIPDPPEVFARAIRDGWDPAERAALAADAEQRMCGVELRHDRARPIGLSGERVVVGEPIGVTHLGRHLRERIAR